MKDSNESVRRNAVWSLGGLKVSNPKVINALLLAMKDSNEGVRRNAAWALRELSSNSNN